MDKVWHRKGEDPYKEFFRPHRGFRNFMVCFYAVGLLLIGVYCHLTGLASFKVNPELVKWWQSEFKRGE